MASKQKNLGQYMTPDRMVNMVLDSVGYTGEKILTKSIIEPSFGEGAFLVEIIRRIITEGRNKGLTNSEIAEIIQQNVYGIEKDTELYNKAIARLTGLLKTEGIATISWSNLTNGDTLLEYNKHLHSKDYCVGNPPFVRIHNIQPEYREIIKEFQFSGGMLDLYITFYEIGLAMLNSTGKLGYISANSFLRNSSQAKFCQYLIENRYLEAIYDFKTSKIFGDTSTYTCICVLNNDNKRQKNTVEYKEYRMYDVVTQNTLEYAYFEKLGSKPWNLGSAEDTLFLAENRQTALKVKDLAVIQNAVATYKDLAYIFKVFKDKELTQAYYGKHTDIEQIVYFNNKGVSTAIESSILHRCVKASKFNGNIENKYILFPYKAEKRFQDNAGLLMDSKYVPLTENELAEKYPLAYVYLLSIKEELVARDIDKNTAWFLFGRSQGIVNSCFKKIVFKHIIAKETGNVVPYILDSDVIAYSGIYTTVQLELCTGSSDGEKCLFNVEEYDKTLSWLQNIFASEDFCRYCKLVGADKSGGYISLSTKMIQAFGVDKK